MGDLRASGFNHVRTEHAEKLIVPFEMSSVVWAFLDQRYLESPDALQAIDPLFTSQGNDEDLTDVYFDTPALDLLAHQNGVRHRTRVRLTDASDPKSERELMQIELNDTSSSELERRELKFAIKHLNTPPADGRESLSRPWHGEARHPMLDIVKRSRRDDFQKSLVDLGLDPRSMRRILTVRHLRRHIDVTRGGKPFLSISMDFASSSLWWAQTRFAEIELTLHGIAFTDADAETHGYMKNVLGRIVGEIRAQFPELQSDPTPTYNKSFESLERQLPFLRMLVRTNTHRSGGLLLFAIIGLGVLAGALLAPLRLVRKRTSVRKAEPPALASRG